MARYALALLGAVVPALLVTSPVAEVRAEGTLVLEAYAGVRSTTWAYEARYPRDSVPPPATNEATAFGGRVGAYVGVRPVSVGASLFVGNAASFVGGEVRVRASSTVVFTGGAYWGGLETLAWGPGASVGVSPKAGSGVYVTASLFVFRGRIDDDVRASVRQDLLLLGVQKAFLASRRSLDLVRPLGRFAFLASSLGKRPFPAPRPARSPDAATNDRTCLDVLGRVG